MAFDSPIQISLEEMSITAVLGFAFIVVSSIIPCIRKRGSI
jgi:hypothetical protein